MHAIPRPKTQSLCDRVEAAAGRPKELAATKLSDGQRKRSKVDGW